MVLCITVLSGTVVDCSAPPDVPFRTRCLFSQLLGMLTADGSQLRLSLGIALY